MSLGPATLITGIAELVDQRPGAGRRLAPRAASRMRRSCCRTTRSPGSVRPHRPRTPTSGATSVGVPVVPGFVDTHTHLVFAGDRAAEFAARMAGEPYTGGGIATTVAATRAASDDELRALLAAWSPRCARQGTTTVEVKSGYGLTVERRGARAATRRARSPTETTFLGAHVVPVEYADRRDDYVALVTGPMLDGVRAARALGRRLLRAGPARVRRRRGPHRADGGHGGRAAGPGARQPARPPARASGSAVELGAASVDHCTYLTDADVEALAASGDRLRAGGRPRWRRCCPAVEFSTRSPYPDARRLLDAGVVVALATDCNPGTCYSSSMPLCIALAVREMRMTPARGAVVGDGRWRNGLAPRRHRPALAGARADLTVLDAPSYLHLAYRPGVPIASALELAAPAGAWSRAGAPGRGLDVLELGRQVPGRAPVVVRGLPGRESQRGAWPAPR